MALTSTPDPGNEVGGAVESDEDAALADAGDTANTP